MKLWHMSSTVLEGFYASEVYAAAMYKAHAIHVALLAYDRWIEEYEEDFFCHPLIVLEPEEKGYEELAQETRLRFHNELKDKLKPCPGRAYILYHDFPDL